MVVPRGAERKTEWDVFGHLILLRPWVLSSVQILGGELARGVCRESTSLLAFSFYLYDSNKLAQLDQVILYRPI